MVLLSIILLSACVPDIEMMVDDLMHTIPDTNPGKRMKETIELIDSGNQEVIQDYVEEEFTPEYLEAAGVDSIVSIYMDFYENEGGIEFEKVREAGPRIFVGHFTSKKDSSTILFGLRTERWQPHRIKELIYE